MIQIITTIQKQGTIGLFRRIISSDFFVFNGGNRYDWRPLYF